MLKERIPALVMPALNTWIPVSLTRSTCCFGVSKDHTHFEGPRLCKLRLIQ